MEQENEKRKYLIVGGGVVFLVLIVSFFVFSDRLEGSGISPIEQGIIAPTVNIENTVDLPSGQKISSELISVKFKDGTSQDIIDNIVENAGGVIGGVLPDIAIYIKFPEQKSSDEILEIVEILQKNEYVESASPEYFYELLNSGFQYK